VKNNRWAERPTFCGRIIMKVKKELTKAEKAELYDKMIEARRKGAEITNNISLEARKERARKAALARWHKD
jgi:hypothetical protein